MTVDSKDFLPPAPKGSGDEELMGRHALQCTHLAFADRVAKHVSTECGTG